MLIVARGNNNCVSAVKTYIELSSAVEVNPGDYKCVIWRIKETGTKVNHCFLSIIIDLVIV